LAGARRVARGTGGDSDLAALKRYEAAIVPGFCVEISAAGLSSALYY
jgi:hypothetical protein